ncbi:hypothetical protein [Saccharopolyspora sp. NPDC002376]
MTNDSSSGTAATTCGTSAASAPAVHQLVAEHGASEAEVIAGVVASRDMATYLRSAGMTDELLAALHDRLLT